MSDLGGRSGAGGDDDRPLLVALDGDGLLHRAFHGWSGEGEGDRDADGNGVWALRGLVSAVAAAAARLRPDAVLVALDSRVDPFRKAMHPAYKAHRPERDPELAAQLDAAPALLADAGVPYAQVSGHEGDDVLASAAALAARSGWRCVLVTSDRDSFALLDAGTSVLRVMDGGVDSSPLVTPAELGRGWGVRPEQYADLAALRGDVSDNLPGVPGIGTRTAARLLEAFGDLDTALAVLDGDGPDGEVLDDGEGLSAVAAVIGPSCAQRLATPQARQTVALNRRLMAMRRDLPLPALEAIRLPLQRRRLVQALHGRSILLGPSLWALVGEDPPPWVPPGWDKAPRALPGGVPLPWSVRDVPTLEDLALLRLEQDEHERRAARAVRLAAPRRPGARARRLVVPEGQLTLF